MGKKANRTCIICKTQYYFCPNCHTDADKPTWYFIFDGENCHDIYEICTQYRDQIIDAKTAYDRMSKCDISKMDNFADSTKAQIKEIMNYKESKVEKVQENKVETKSEIKENIKSEIKSETKSEVKPTEFKNKK